MFQPSDDSDFNLERHLIPYLQDNPFFAEISRRIKKIPTKDPKCPTAAVTYDPETSSLQMFYNTDFFKTLSDQCVRGVLEHEFYHPIFGHLSFRRKKPHRNWNVATDLAINSIITFNKTTHNNGSSHNDVQLPDMALIPGRRPKPPADRPFTEKELKVAKLIESFPPNKASEFYLEKLNELADEDDDGEGSSGIDSMDDHDIWDSVPEEDREWVEGYVRDIITNAARVADTHPNGWGKMPSHIRQEIQSYIKGELDWRQILRQFVGSTVRNHRTSTIKRINRRYPMIHPGKKFNYTAKLLIAIDQSGSVIDDWLSDFFTELGDLTRKISISILPFDSHANVNEVEEWRKGQRLPTIRKRCGGTDFNAPTQIFNDPNNRGRWDALIIMTDGGAFKPIPCRGKRAWILARGTKLMFETDEQQIFLSKDKKPEGAWR